MKRIATSCALVLVLLGCGKSAPGPELPARAVQQPNKAASANATAGLPYVRWVKVASGTHGPMVVPFTDGSVAVWAEPAGEAREFRSLAVDETGRPLAAPSSLGPAPATIGLFTLQRAGSSLPLLMAYTAPDDRGSQRVLALPVDRTGRATRPPLELGTSGEAILWLQVLPTAKGPVLLWASSRGDRADLRAVCLDPKGEIREGARDVITDVRAWQIVPTPSGAALAVVHAVPNQSTGNVSLLLLDPNARVVGKPIPVGETKNAELDVDLVGIDGRFLVAFTERKKDDARVMLALLDGSGQVLRAPSPITPPRGEQVLSRLVGSVQGGPAYVVWEDLSLPDPPRTVTIASVDRDGKLAVQPIRLQVAATSASPLELAATTRGLAGLALLAGADPADPEQAVPWFFELTPNGGVQASSPIRMAAPGTPIPALTFNLECGSGCRALAAMPGDPSQIAMLDLSAIPPRATRGLPALLPAPTQGPTLRSVDATRRVEPLSDLVATSVSNRLVTALVTYFDPGTPLARLPKPGPDGRTDPLQARVDVGEWTSSGVSSPGVVSYRAASAGGVALQASARNPNELLAGWSALDGGHPQVFLTRVDVQGRKLSQKMLTRRKLGGVTDVAVLPADTGWLVAWADGRHGNFEVYSASVTAMLERTGDERRLTEAAGDATELSLVRYSKGAFLVWADARDQSHPGRSDIFLRPLSTANGQPTAEERRVVETSRNAHAPITANLGSQVVLAWVETELLDSSHQGASVAKLALLDDQGALAGQPIEIVPAWGTPLAVALYCDGSLCRGVLNVDAQARGELHGFVVDPRQSGVYRARPLWRGQGPAEQTLAPVVTRDAVLAVDRIENDRVSVVHLTIDWQPQ